jgi:hypothetical protein
LRGGRARRPGPGRHDLAVPGHDATDEAEIRLVEAEWTSTQQQGSGRRVVRDRVGETDLPVGDTRVDEFDGADRLVHRPDRIDDGEARS